MKIYYRLNRLKTVGKIVIRLQFVLSAKKIDAIWDMEATRVEIRIFFVFSRVLLSGQW